MAFELVEKGQQSESTPALVVYQDGNSRLTAAADRECLTTPPAVRMLVGTGADAGRLRIEGCDSSAEHSYAITRDYDDRAGGDLSTKTTLRDDAGVDIDALDESVRLDVEKVEGEAALVADLTPLPGVDADGTESPSDEDGTDPATNGHAAAGTDDEDSTDKSSATPWTDTSHSREERVRLLVEHLYEREGGRFETTCGRIANALGPDVDGRAVPHVFDKLGGWTFEVVGDDNGASVYRVTRAGEGDSTDDSTGAEVDGDTTSEDWADRPIGVKHQGKLVDIPAGEVVHAVAAAPDKQRVQGRLEVDMAAVEDLLATLDLAAQFETDAPLRESLVRQTVKAYLEVDA